MPPPDLPISLAEARRLHRRLTRLDHPLSSVHEALVHHGYVQIDPLNVCGRMHDLILRNRVTDYREGDLMRHLHGEEEPLPASARLAFEHHHPDTHILVAFGLEAWPFLHSAMQSRSGTASAWSGKLLPEENALARDILAEMKRSSHPLNSDDFKDGRAGKSVWGKASLAKATLQKLFFHGRLLIARREGNRRFYDLPERVLPATTLSLPGADEATIERWQLLLRLRQHRLTPLTKAERPFVEDLVQPLAIEDGPDLFCLRNDLPVLEALRSEKPDKRQPALQLLAPLDPLIYNRRVTRSLWDFDYTWEVYTPEAKRVRGYYALPVLRDTRLLGHVEPRMEREETQLRLLSAELPARCNPSPALKSLARFLGMKRVVASAA